MENKFRNWIIKHSLSIGMVLLGIFALYIRYACWPMISSDLLHYNIQWYNALLKGGITAVFEPSLNWNYSPMHLYIWYFFGKLFPNVFALTALKIISIFFEILLCVSLLVLLKRLLSKTEKSRFYFFIGYILIIFNPISIINAACWGQTDVIFALLSVLALLSYMDGKTNLTMVWLGLSLAFKMQALFLFPVFILLYFIGPKRINILSFLIIPIVWVLSGVPLAFVGRSPLIAVETYMGQTTEFGYVLTAGAPNAYALMGDFAFQREWILTLLNKLGIVFAIAVIITMGVYLILQKKKITNQSLILLSAWFVFACVYFLPRMHDRYTFVGEVLLFVWVLATHKPYRYLYIIGTIITIFNSYITFLVGYHIFPLQIGGLIYTIIFVALTYEVYRVRKYTDVEEIDC